MAGRGSLSQTSSSWREVATRGDAIARRGTLADCMALRAIPIHERSSVANAEINLFSTNGSPRRSTVSTRLGLAAVVCVQHAFHSICTRADGLLARALRRVDVPVQERCVFSVISLSLSAIRPSSGRERVFILCIALLRWTFTVASAMPISSAICLLRRPRAT
jgi:hypothetical protein